jgi:hypothetical protein
MVIEKWRTPGRTGQRCRAVAQVVKQDRREAMPSHSSMNRLVTLARWISSPFWRVETPP